MKRSIQRLLAIGAFAAVAGSGAGAALAQTPGSAGVTPDTGTVPGTAGGTTNARPVFSPGCPNGVDDKGNCIRRSVELTPPAGSTSVSTSGAAGGGATTGGSGATTSMGGGTSSRLWQTVREERGLAYSVGAGGSTFSDVGVFTIYAGTSPEHLDEVLDISLDEMRRVVNESVPEDELKLAKEQALSSILLSLESSSARVSALARQEIIHGRRISPQEIIEKMDAVTADAMQRVAQEYFHSEKIALGALGNLNGFNVDRSRLRI